MTTTTVTTTTVGWLTGRSAFNWPKDFGKHQKDIPTSPAEDPAWKLHFSTSVRGDNTHWLFVRIWDPSRSPPPENSHTQSWAPRSSQPSLCRAPHSDSCTVLSHTPLFQMAENTELQGIFSPTWHFHYQCIVKANQHLLFRLYLSDKHLQWKDLDRHTDRKELQLCWNTDRHFHTGSDCTALKHMVQHSSKELGNKCSVVYKPFLHFTDAFQYSEWLDKTGQVSCVIRKMHLLNEAQLEKNEPTVTAVGARKPRRTETDVVNAAASILTRSIGTLHCQYSQGIRQNQIKNRHGEASCLPFTTTVPNV